MDAMKDEAVPTIVERLRITHLCTAGYNRATWIPQDWNLLNEAADELERLLASEARKCTACGKPIISYKVQCCCDYGTKEQGP
jgi:hypothetical protein